MRLAELQQLVEDACHGDLLQNDEELRPVAQDPHIWELKIKFDDRPYRLYFGEPPTAPGYLVGLHFHHKRTEGTPEEIRRAQNDEIALARSRYQQAEANGWEILAGSHACRRR